MAAAIFEYAHRLRRLTHGHFSTQSLQWKTLARGLSQKFWSGVKFSPGGPRKSWSIHGILVQWMSIVGTQLHVAALIISCLPPQQVKSKQYS